MKINISGVFICIICLCFFSCKDNIPHKHKIVSEWDEVILTPIPTTEFDDHIGLLAIYNVGDYILGYQYRQDYFFKVFDKEYNVIGELCRRGNGPNEFVQVSYFGQYETGQTGTKIWVLDMVKKDFIKINIEQTVADNKISTEKNIDLKRVNEIEPRNLFYLDDSHLIGTDDKMDCKIFTINPANSKPIFFEHYPSFPEKNYTHDISQNIMALKPDRTRLASVFFSIPQIDLIKATGETYFSLFFNERIDLGNIHPAEIDDMEVFIKVEATDKYIYILSEIVENGNKQAVYVIDWEGVPHYKMYIDPATYFCVQGDEKIYSFDFSSESEVVKTYDISQLL